MHEALGGVEAFLPSRCRSSSGRSFGLADVAYIPWLLRLRDLLGFSLDRHETIVGWLDACAERPSVAAEIETVASLIA